MKLILASSSKHRQDIFNMLGFKYDVVTSLVDEESDETDPVKYVMELSKNKAKSVRGQLNEKAIIIAADEVIFLDNKMYEKPKSREEAFNNMKEISGKTVKAITGITIIDMYQDRIVTVNDTTEVLFNEMTDDEIRWYVDNEERILNNCGFTILGKGAIFIKEITGDYNNLFGISPTTVYQELLKLGYKLTDFELR